MAPGWEVNEMTHREEQPQPKDLDIVERISTTGRTAQGIAPDARGEHARVERSHRLVSIAHRRIATFDAGRRVVI